MSHSAVVLTNALFILCLLMASLQLRRVVPNERTFDRLALAFGAAIVSSLIVVADRNRLGWIWVAPTHAGIFVSHAAMWCAIWERMGRAPPLRLVGLGAGLLTVGLVVIGPEPEARSHRVALASAIHGVGFALAAFHLLRRDGPAGAARRMDDAAGVFFAILALGMVGGAGAGLLGATVVDVWLFTLVVFPALFAAGGLCLLLGYVGETLRTSERLAATDPLTGIANRRGFEVAVETALARGRAEAVPVVLVIADVDGLKAINDGFGHPTGDRVIQAAALALRRGGSPTEPLARLGGDEFGLLITGHPVERVEERLGRAQAALTELGPAELPAGLTKLSFGLAAQRPGETTDYAALYAAADGDLLTRRARLREPA